MIIWDADARDENERLRNSNALLMWLRKTRYEIYPVFFFPKTLETIDTREN